MEYMADHGCVSYGYRSLGALSHMTAVNRHAIFSTKAQLQLINLFLIKASAMGNMGVRIKFSFWANSST